MTDAMTSTVVFIYKINTWLGRKPIVNITFLKYSFSYFKVSLAPFNSVL